MVGKRRKEKKGEQPPPLISRCMRGAEGSRGSGQQSSKIQTTRSASLPPPLVVIRSSPVSYTLLDRQGARGLSKRRPSPANRSSPASSCAAPLLSQLLVLVYKERRPPSFSSCFLPSENRRLYCCCCWECSIDPLFHRSMRSYC